MKTEVSRTIKGNTIVVGYDDGSTETIRMEEAPRDIVVDSDILDSSVQPKGHVFPEVS